MRILLYFLMLLNLRCSTGPCDVGKVERIQEVEGGNNGFVSYYHEVLMEGISPSCLDSLVMLNMISKYLDTSSHKPIRSITIFKSKSGYDMGETLSQPERYYANQVFSVSFIDDTSIPSKFIFYKNGKILHEGEDWLKQKPNALFFLF